MNGLIESIMRVVDQQHRYYTSIDKEYWIEFQPEYTDAIRIVEDAGLIESSTEVVMGGKTYAAEDGCVWIRKKI